MAFMSILVHGTSSLNPPKPTSRYNSRRGLKFPCSFIVPRRPPNSGISVFQFFKPSIFSRIRSFQREDSENYEAEKYTLDHDQDKVADEVLGKNPRNKPIALRTSFLLTFAIPLGVAVVFTIFSVLHKQPSDGFFGVQFLAEGSPSSVMDVIPAGFTFKSFGYKIVLPEHAPGWIYFWLLMAAGCGLFISEEALNIWACPFYRLAYRYHGCFLWMGHGNL